MPIGEICNREVVFVGRDDTVQEAARLMRQHHVGDLVVAEDRGGVRYPVGMLTDRDLVVEVLAAGVDIDTVSVGDIMSTDPAVARESDGIYDTIQRMRARAVRRIPVVGGHGELVGIVAVDDLLELLADEIMGLAALAGREQAHERRARR
ncbi:MAG: CBS domain-containing protein [Gammaproteobacteria bacterium]|nr:CBS domain-containing protein [Gammaproteobacteria bacterium]